MREVVSKSGAHYRLCATDATVIEIQTRHRMRWATFRTCPDAEQARAWLAILGDLRRDEQPDMTQEDMTQQEGHP